MTEPMPSVSTRDSHGRAETPDLGAVTSKPVPGWHNFTRDNRAHYLTAAGHVLCQLSHVGDPIPVYPEHARVIERVCEDCRAVYKARVGMALRKAARQP